MNNNTSFRGRATMPPERGSEVFIPKLQFLNRFGILYRAIQVVSAV